MFEDRLAKLDGKTAFVLISHGVQVLLSLAGVICSYIAMTKLRGYEKATKKLAEYSETAENELSKTRTTQGAGALATLLSLIAALALLLFQPSLSNYVSYGLSPFMLLTTLFARGHVKNYWQPAGKRKQMKVPALPKLEDYQTAQRRTDDLLQVLEYLEYSWLASCVVGGLVGYD